MRLENTEQLMSLIALYREHQAEIDRYPGAKMERVMDMLHKVFLGEPDWFGEVVMQDGDVVGMVLGLRMRELLSDELVAQEMVVYLRPDLRHDQAAKMEVIRAWHRFADWARAQGCKRIKALSYGEFAAMLERDGFTQYAVALYKEL